MGNVGRPSTYDAALAEELCEAVATDARPIYLILDETSQFPSESTFYRWADAHPEFREILQRAKHQRAWREYSRLRKTVDDVDCDVPNGIGAARVQKARLQVLVGTMQLKALSRHDFGDARDLSVRTPDGLQIESKTETELNANQLGDVLEVLREAKAVPE